MKKRIKILLADPRTLVRSGIRALLEKSRTMKIVAEAANSRDLLRLAGEQKPDVIVLDAGLPNGDGLSATALLHQRQHPPVPVILLSTGSNGEQASRAFQASASGYLLLKSKPCELTKAIRRVAAGRIYVDPSVPCGADANAHVRGEALRWSSAMLTPRQSETLRLIGEGKNAKEIASLLGVSSKTVDFHRKRLMERVKTHTVAGLVREAIRRGLVS